jgi:sugar phosphate isomerase/epimerase
MSSQIGNQSRRNFLKKSLLTGVLVPLAYQDLFSMYHTGAEKPLKIHIFSKHLQFLNYRDMAEAAAEMGFDGIDLTVRPNGHVLPERVETDLPKAVEAMKKVNFVPSLMTTAVDDAGDSTDRKVLDVAAILGFKFYRMNYFSYPDGITMPAAMEQFQQRVKKLSLLNKELRLTGCYQNHSGDLAGSSIWELWELMKEADQQYMGLQYDIRHAVVEGALSWQNGLRLVQSEIKTIALKDFTWRNENGKSVIRDIPISEGTVDFTTYFKLLKQYKINVPVSMHTEYPLGGAEHGATRLSCDKQVVFNAMKKDLQKIRDLWQQE